MVGGSGGNQSGRVKVDGGGGGGGVQGWDGRSTKGDKKEDSWAWTMAENKMY